jgi:hypothetical protein
LGGKFLIFTAKGLDQVFNADRKKKPAIGKSQN